ncbi:Uncharacterized protein HZ326_28156 [Fusarium oxysporum f. sp. albedinis]|nr:Uncharacterized protein HZ326_28156 [Fusarium oxysporum f. sp. albedinis]
MRDMCKMSHLTIANNYLYWNLGLLISRPDRVVRWWGTATSLTSMTELASDSDSRSLAILCALMKLTLSIGAESVNEANLSNSRRYAAFNALNTPLSSGWSP